MRLSVRPACVSADFHLNDVHSLPGDLQTGSVTGNTIRDYSFQGCLFFLGRWAVVWLAGGLAWRNDTAHGTISSQLHPDPPDAFMWPFFPCAKFVSSHPLCLLPVVASFPLPVLFLLHSWSYNVRPPSPPSVLLFSSFPLISSTLPAPSLVTLLSSPFLLHSGGGKGHRPSFQSNLQRAEGRTSGPVFPLGFLSYLPSSQGSSCCVI